MNQQQKYILNLQRKSRDRRREQAFIVEGKKLFEEAPEDRITMIVVSESFCRSREGSQLLKGRKYDVVSDAVFETLSDTKSPQGIMAVVKQASYTLKDLLGDGSRQPLILVLEHLQDPGNLGTMLRAGEAAGITGVLMNSDCVDIYNPKTVRGTMGSLFRVPFLVTEDLQRDLALLKEKGVVSYAAHLEGSVSYEAGDYRQGTAFLIGNEANGLSDALSAVADRRIRIPMEGRVESLNAAMAATVLMFEAARQRRQ